MQIGGQRRKECKVSLLLAGHQRTPVGKCFFEGLCEHGGLHQADARASLPRRLPLSIFLPCIDSVTAAKAEHTPWCDCYSMEMSASLERQTQGKPGVLRAGALATAVAHGRPRSSPGPGCAGHPADKSLSEQVVRSGSALQDCLPRLLADVDPL